MDNLPRSATEYRQWWARQRPDIPYGECWCGCGHKTRIADRNRKQKGRFKGQPLTYIHGHHTAKSLPSDHGVNRNGGRCYCGCGRLTAIAALSSRKDGTIKGKHLRYINGHNGSYLPPAEHGVNENGGLCYCECGQQAPIATKTKRIYGVVKGKPLRYIYGHYNRKSEILYIEENRGYKTPCWIWQGANNGAGYGQITSKGKHQYAHRVFYEQKYGPISEGLVIDHLCKTTLCCNPDHLKPVTRRENFLRG